MSYLSSKISKIKFLQFIVLVIIFSAFSFLAFLNIELKKQISLVETYKNPIDFTPESYPKVIYPYEPYISAQGAVVIDKSSQVVLYEKNSKLRFSPASTTKIMTAIVALENYNLDDTLTVYKSNVEGTNQKLMLNEKIKLEDLLYAMMLPSSNDAAQAIADNFPGGESAFVAMMNKKAKELYLDNTHFAEPIGLLDREDYTTSIELARLTSYALENPEFAKIVATKIKTITTESGNKYTFPNINIMLNYPGVNGVKTGYTEGAGQVLVTSQKINNGKDLIFVVMQSQDRFRDTEYLLNYLNNNITFLSSRP